jgi:hypothetical protein
MAPMSPSRALLTTSSEHAAAASFSMAYTRRRSISAVAVPSTGRLPSRA